MATYPWADGAGIRPLLALSAVAAHVICVAGVGIPAASEVGMSALCAGLFRHLQQFVHIPGTSLWAGMLAAQSHLCKEPALKTMLSLLSRAAAPSGMAIAEDISTHEAADLASAWDLSVQGPLMHRQSCPHLGILAAFRRLADELQQAAFLRCLAGAAEPLPPQGDELAFLHHSLCIARPSSPDSKAGTCCTRVGIGGVDSFEAVAQAAIFRNAPIPLEAALWQLRNVAGVSNMVDPAGAEPRELCSAHGASAWFAIADAFRWRFAANWRDVAGYIRNGLRCLSEIMQQDVLGALTAPALPFHILDRVCLEHEVQVQLAQPLSLTKPHFRDNSSSDPQRPWRRRRRLAVAVLPYRDVVSDHIRATRTAHCPGRFQDLVVAAVREAAVAGCPARVIEAGAFLGDCVLWAGASFPEVDAIAVEPFVEAARRLQRSAAPLGGRVRVVPSALGRQVGHWHAMSESDATQHYFTSSGHFAGAGAVIWEPCNISLAMSSREIATTRSELEAVDKHPYQSIVLESMGCVHFTTLDALLSSEGWSKVDLLRLAVIGNEVEALEGARLAMQQRAIETISVECINLQCDAEAVKRLAEFRGYCVSTTQLDARLHLLLRPC